MKRMKRKSESGMERVAGITRALDAYIGAKRIIKELKVLKSRCILVRAILCVPERFPVSLL